MHNDDDDDDVHNDDVNIRHFISQIKRLEAHHEQAHLGARDEKEINMSTIARLDAEVAAKNIRIEALETQLRIAATESSQEIARLRMMLFEFEMNASFTAEDDDVLHDQFKVTAGPAAASASASRSQSSLPPIASSSSSSKASAAVMPMVRAEAVTDDEAYSVLSRTMSGRLLYEKRPRKGPMYESAGQQTATPPQQRAAYASTESTPVLPRKTPTPPTKGFPPATADPILEVSNMTGMHDDDDDHVDVIILRN